jgi:hypothetical protein
MSLNYFKIPYIARSYVKCAPQLWKVNIRMTLEDSASLRAVNLVSGDGTFNVFYENLSTNYKFNYILADPDCTVVKLI